MIGWFIDGHIEIDEWVYRVLNIDKYEKEIVKTTAIEGAFSIYFDLKIRWKYLNAHPVNTH